MTLENEFFKRKEFIPEKLFLYGFIPREDGLYYTTRLPVGLSAFMKVRKTGECSLRLIDGDLGEEYTLFRAERAEGAFVTAVRDQVLSLLSDIAEKTTKEKLYFSPQANDLSSFISERFGVSPEFMWKKFPHYGVYRNIHSGK